MIDTIHILDRSSPLSERICEAAVDSQWPTSRNCKSIAGRSIRAGSAMEQKLLLQAQLKARDRARHRQQLLAQHLLALTTDLEGMLRHCRSTSTGAGDGAGDIKWANMVLDFDSLHQGEESAEVEDVSSSTKRG